MSALRQTLQTGLSEGVAIDSLTREGDIFVLQLHDPDGQPHTIEFWKINADRKAFQSGNLLAFAYRRSSDPSSAHAFEQRVIATWRLDEERIEAAARDFVEPAKVQPAPRQPLFLRETTISLRVARALPHARSLVGAVREAFAEELCSTSPPSEVQVYFETACAQACEFCEEPQKRVLIHRRAAQRLLVLQHDTHFDIVSSGIFRELVQWVTERGLPVRITGHDWTRHPHRDELLRVLERAEGAKIRFQGPSLALASSSLARRIAALPGLESVATTLQSSDPTEHDAMVGARNAHACLLNALENLQMLGVQVILSVVLTRRAVRSLAKTLEFVKERGWRVELVAFVPDRSMLRAGEKLVPLDELRLALEMAGAVAEAAVSSLVGVPHCAVPEALRSKIARVLETRERDPLAFGLVCRTCTQHRNCSGVVLEYAHVYGDRGLKVIH